MAPQWIIIRNGKVRLPFDACVRARVKRGGGQDRMRSIGRRPLLAIQAVTASGGREKENETWRGRQRQ